MTDLATKAGAQDLPDDDDVTAALDLELDETEAPDDAVEADIDTDADAEAGAADELPADDADEEADAPDAVDDAVATDVEDADEADDADEEAELEAEAEAARATDAEPEAHAEPEPEPEPEPEASDDLPQDDVETAEDAGAADVDDLAPDPDAEPEDAPVPDGALAAAPVAASAALPLPPVLPVVPGTVEAPGAVSEPMVQWAPAEPARRTRHLGWWIGVPAAVAVVGLVASSLILIAPGTSIAGVAVGGMTPGTAADAVSARLAETTIVLSGEGGDVEVTGAELAASVRSRELANDAFAEHPMWNPTEWFSSPDQAIVQLDPDVATAVLRDAAPSLYTDPVDAQLAFDADTASFVVTPAILGTGIDVDSVRAALQDAFDSGTTRVEFEPVAAPIDAETQTYVADATAYRLNRMLDSLGFYVGDELVVPVDRALAASWITLGDGPRGTFSIDVDQQAIQAFVDTLPDLVHRDPVNATVITDSGGNVLRVVSEGVEGRALESTDGIAAALAEQIKGVDGVYQLPVATIPFTTTALARRIEVNLSQQRVYLFENGNVVSSSFVSSGLPGHDTDPGHFRIYTKLTSQNMGNRDLTKPPNYFQPNVPWVMYYNGDEALHGAYWHNSFGSRRSHGCVNLPVGFAAYLFDWAPMNTEVWVHY